MVYTEEVMLHTDGVHRIRAPNEKRELRGAVLNRTSQEKTTSWFNSCMQSDTTEFKGAVLGHTS